MMEYLQGLTKKQQQALVAIVENLSEGLTETELAKRAGVSRQTLWELRKKPEFQEALREMVRDELTGKVDFAAKKLLQKVDEGNVKCLLALLELTGLYATVNRNVNLDFRAELERQSTREFLIINGEKKYYSNLHPDQIAREYIRRLQNWGMDKEILFEHVKDVYEEYEESTAE